jgi:hypothetical protein
MKNPIIQDLIVTAFGFVTSWATAYALVYFEHEHQVSIYAWLYAFIIPVGAILSGFVAATGYWIGARVFNHRPTKSILWNMVTVSILTFFMIHEQGHDLAVKRGYPKGYWTYLQEVTESMSYSSGRGSSKTAGEPLGALGYGVVALEILGFTFGAFAVYGVLRSRQYCEPCSKYFSKKGQRLHHLADLNQLNILAQKFHQAMSEQRYQEAINEYCAQPKAKMWKKSVMSTLQLFYCKNCGKHQIVFSASTRNGNQWAPVTQLALNQNVDVALQFPNA